MKATTSPQQLSARRQAFRQLHESGCFVIPNPWDTGSACYLQRLGFKALATTSSGAAWRHAKADGQMSVDETLVHLREMVAATELPVNADFESGFAPDAAGVARNVRLAVETGVAGLSIEDSTGDAGEPLRDIEALGVRRVSVGGALARTAWGGFMRAAQTIAAEGKFDGFAAAAGGAELNALFRKG